MNSCIRLKYPNGINTHSGIKWILSSISYPTFFPQLPQNAIPAFNGVPHSEQKRGFTLSSAGAGVGADSLSATGSDAGSAAASVTGAVTGGEVNAVLASLLDELTVDEVHLEQGCKKCTNVYHHTRACTHSYWT